MRPAYTRVRSELSKLGLRVSSWRTPSGESTFLCRPPANDRGFFAMRQVARAIEGLRVVAFLKAEPVTGFLRFMIVTRGEERVEQLERSLRQLRREENWYRKLKEEQNQ